MVFTEIERKEETQGMKEISPGLSLEYGQKIKSYIAIDTLALESRKIIEFQTKRKKV